MGKSLTKLEFYRVIKERVFGHTSKFDIGGEKKHRTYLRTSRTTKCLHNLALILIEKEFSSELFQDPPMIV